MVHMAQDYTNSLKAILSPISAWNGALYASPVTGDIVTSPQVLSPEHFVKNLVSPVLFSEAFENMCFGEIMSDGTPRPAGQDVNVDLIVEIGAHSTLSGPIRHILKSRKIPYVSCLKRSVNAVNSIQDATCELLARGYPVSLAGVNFHENGTFVPGLPSYAWNHTSSYWMETRTSRKHLNKRFPPHELLGTPLLGSNRLTPTWRNFLRTTDIPWLTEHKVGTHTVFPGAGYVAMAIEAVRLLTDPLETTIHAYRLRDIEITNALTIPDSSTGVEVQLCLRPCSEKELDYKGWYDFEIYSIAGKKASWLQHCKGFVTAETIVSTKPAATTTEMKAPHSDSFFTPGVKVAGVDTESVFARLRAMTIFHGPAFQNLISSQKAANKNITTLAISPATLDCDETYVLHPTTLDSLIVAAYISVPEITAECSMVIPRSIRRLFVPRGTNRQASDKLKAFIELQKANKRGAKLTSIAMNENDDEESTSLFRMEDLYLQTVALDEANSANVKDPAFCSESRWELDILHEFPSKLKDTMRINLDDAQVEFEKKLNRVSYNFIHNAVAKLEGSENIKNWQPQHKSFYDWMKSVVEKGKAGELGPGSRSWSKSNKGIKQRLADDLEAESAAGKLLTHIGRNLTSIVRGEIESLALMMQDGLMNQYLEELPRLKERTYKHLRRIIELFAVKQPSANVLEIGGHEGAATRFVLEGFATKAENESGLGSLLGHYDFTDESLEFFDVVRDKFASWGAAIDFKKLDITSDPAQQSFAAASYDLVVVSSVSHEASNLERAMKHIRQLLKPGGKLLMVETTRDRLDSQLLVGTLPRWWQGEEPVRKTSPTASVETWNDLLKATGFTGVDFEIGDCEETQFQSTSVILSTASELQPAYPSSVSIVHTQTSASSRIWLEELAGAIKIRTGASVAIESLEDLQAKNTVVYIFTTEMAQLFLHNINSINYEKLRRLLLDGQGLLWLSCSSVIDAKEPLYAQSQGLLRTAKQEDSTKRYIQLDFELSPEGPWSQDKIAHIVHVLQRSFNNNVELRDIEWEYAIKDSMLHVPRIYPSPANDKASSEQPVDPAPEVQPFWQEGRPLVWESTKAGSLSNLYFVDNVVIRDTDVPSGWVEIKTQALSLNFRDVMVALGQIDDTLVGHDCAGIVTRLGPDTEQSGLKVGDRVCAIGRGRFGSHTRAHFTGVCKIPNEMSWEHAASIPIIYLTSYMCLYDVAHLQKGERILIHAGTGGVGQPAIMMAQHTGAEVFTTCSTEEKRNLLMDHYKLDSDHILSSRDASFADAIMAQTGGAGVDVVINSLSGPLLKATWDCMARFGRFVEIGKVDFEAARCLDMSPFGRCAQMTGFDLLQLCVYNGRVVRQGFERVMRLWNKKAIKPIYPYTVYPISEMETALRKMQRGTHIGKMVLIPGQDDEVNVITRSKRVLSLDDTNSTYMIAGGVGGIGNAIAELMIEKRAKNILIVSRNAESHPKATPLIHKAKADGCHVYIRNCDISDEGSLVKLLADCTGKMPPIRGVIQAAMALDDTILESLTFSQWKRGVMPKVAGSLNLHNHLPDPKFFVMLSSVVGVVGHTSQSNYAAGNTFQDALARHRTANGLPAVAIDLGAVGSVGVVAEANDNMLDRVERNLSSKVIPIEKVLLLIEAAMREPFRKNPDQSQVITGILEYDRIPEDSSIKKDKRFGTLRLENSSSTAGESTKGAARSPDEVLKHSLTMTTPTSPETANLVSDALVNKLASIFNIVAAEIDTGLGLSTLGVDSLVAIELRNWLSSVVQAKVTVFEILQSTTVKDFAGLVVGRSALIN